MASTTETGNDFRDLVCELLRTKFPDAEVEQYVNGTKVDVLFSRHDELGTSELVAVECKDYAAALTKTQISTEIYPQYNNLLQSRAVHRVMIVSRKPLGSAAADFVATWPSASHRTYDELAESLLGVRQYIQHLAALKPTGDGEYIETRLEGESLPALQWVCRWVNGDQGPALALLGGYGQGKTSFANRLAAHFAGLHLQDPSVRMPVLMRLGELVHETQLEGLFGKQFTARHQAHGYQFPTFEHLNRAGRLLVILDGFDEMKHAMTAADFQSTFLEFNRLLVGRAKVVLLGRPNAMHSEDRQLLLRGLATVAGQQIASLNFASWTERKLAFFTPQESRRLLRSTLEKLISRPAAGLTYPARFVDARVDEVFREVQPDMLRRPVHLLIVAELASNKSFNLQGFNEYGLYEHFIQTLVERDTREKRARRAIGLDARLQFQREVAWWAWRRTGSAQGFFHRHEIPDAILAPLPEGQAMDAEGKRNEYIVSTLTEVKESGVLFFAHRSFQEFLVAERARLTPTTPATHAEYSALLTPDILSFLHQAPSREFILQWYGTLRASNGPLHPTYLDYFARFPELLEHIGQTIGEQKPEQIDTWTVCILFSAHRQQTADAPGAVQIQDFLLETVRHGQRDPAATAALAFLQMYGQSRALLLIERLAAAMLERVLARAVLAADRQCLVIQDGESDFAVNWLKTVERRCPPGGDMVLEFNVPDLERACIGEVGPKASREAHLNPFGDLPQRAAQAALTMPAARLYRNLPDAVRKGMSSFLNSRRPKFGVVAVGRHRGVVAPGRAGDQTPASAGASSREGSA